MSVPFADTYNSLSVQSTFLYAQTAFCYYNMREFDIAAGLYEVSQPLSAQGLRVILLVS